MSKRVSKKSPSAEVSESATLSTAKHSPEPSLDGLTYDEDGSTEDKDQTPSHKQPLAERLGWDTTGPPESAYEDAMRSAIFHGEPSSAGTRVTAWATQAAVRSCP